MPVPALPTTPPAWVTRPQRCWGRRKDHKQCGQHPIAGARNCHLHAGNKRARANAEIRDTVTRWGLGKPDVDPGETLMRLLSQSVQRVTEYSTALAEMVDEHGGDIVAAMVGDSYVISDDGHMQKVAEYVRGLAQLEADERDRAANFARIALQAGIAERQLAAAELMGRSMVAILRAVLTDARLALTAEQRAVVPAVMREHVVPALTPAVAAT